MRQAFHSAGVSIALVFGTRSYYSLLMCLYFIGVRYQAGWFRFNQRNVAGEPQRDAAAAVVPEPRQPQNDDDGHADAQVITSLLFDFIVMLHL